MKKINRYFLETLIQLTLLANVFYRDNNIQFTKDLNLIINSNNDPFLLLNNKDLIKNINSNNQKFDFNNNNIQYLTNLIVSPASFLSNNNQDLRHPNETRLLLNSITLNANTQISKDLEMEIGMQAIIEQSIFDQDVDLGYKKNSFKLDLDYQTSSNEFNTFDISNSKMRLNLENQKNNNITVVSDILQNIPEGYRPYLEEDTGELILYLIPRDEDGSNKTNNVNTTIENNDRKFQFLNSTCATEDENSNNSTSNNSLINNLDDSFVSDEQFGSTKSNFFGPEPILLGQNTFNQEFDNFKLVIQSTSNVNHEEPTALNLSSLNEPFLNDTWINEILSSQIESSSQFPVQLDYPSFALNQTNKIELANNQSLLNINANQSIISNELNDTITINNVKYSLTNEKIETSFFDDEFLNKLEIFGEKVNILEGIEISNELLNDSLEKMILNHENDNKIQYIGNNNSTLSSTGEKDVAEYANLNNELWISNDDSAKNNKLHNLKKEPNDLIEQNFAKTHTSTIFDSSFNSERFQLASNQGFLHNHTYSANPNQEENFKSFEELHPYSYKSKQKKMLKTLQDKNQTDVSVSHQASKDEILLRENYINLSLKQIIESSAEDFNELIKNSEFKSDQITLIKDIRRRGKNKIAAQTCRKRKIDSIEYLEKEVENLRELKSTLESDHVSIKNQIQYLTNQFDILYKESLAYNSNAIMSFVQNQLKKDNTTEIEKESKLRTISLRSENDSQYDVFSKDDTLTDDEQEIESFDEDEEDEDSNSYITKSTKKFKKN